MAEVNAVMLPSNVRPAKYRLTLTPDLEGFTFAGRESVEIEVLAPTSSIVVNSAEIEIQSSRLTLTDGSPAVPVSTDFDEEAETVTLEFERMLPTGPATLDLEFTGELNDKLRGFYRSSYLDESGDERYLATTQFEATDARRAFPCWDEPGVKATFQATLLVPSDLVAVSNMPVVSETQEGGRKRVEFAETPVMSTYLLAFVVGDLKSIEERASSDTLMRVWTTAGKEEQGRFTLDVSLKLLDYFNDYFGIPYPLDKLDHLAIPDFAAGAMENWGAITYREVAVLIDPGQSSAQARQIVASIVSHEMAHMWFGDLVTMAWWNDLWLNESFASWMGDKAVDHLFPEWDMWTQFVSGDTNRALSLDGLKSSHPIEQEVKNPAEIGQLFDAISYSKGGSVLRMLERFLGEEPFRNGLRQYLTEHKYGNARTQDLWDALERASGEPVVAMMDSWVKQTGYPVVDVESEPSADGVTIHASQSRFVYEHIEAPEETDETLWQVPMRARGPDEASISSTLMGLPEASLDVAVPADAWIKVNPEQTGFFRVNYSADGWARLIPAVQKQLLPPLDRLGLQNDAFAMSRAGFLPTTQFLGLAEAYVDETDATVWDDLSTNLGALDNLLSDEAFYDRYEAFGRRIFQLVGARVGWSAREGEGHLDALLRTTVLGALGGYGDEDTLRQAAELFTRYQEDSSAVNPDLRQVVLSLTAKRGDRATYDEMWELYGKSELEEEKVRFLAALSGFELTELLDETLDRSMSDEVRVHDTIRVVAGVSMNRYGKDRAWEFLKSHWTEFDRRYGEGGFGLMQLVSVAGRFTTQEKLDDVDGFFKEHPTPAADRTIRQALERIRLNIAWLDKNRDGLAEWLVG